MELAIINGTVVSHLGRYKADIAVADGVITALVKPGGLRTGEARTVIDAGGLFVLPGCIEAHSHFREPGHEYKEDFYTGSMAAAAGGITTVFEMANTKPLADGPKEILDKIALISGRSFVDYCLHGLVTKRNIGRLTEMLAVGVRGFKAMMSLSAMGTPTVDDGELLCALRELQKTDTVLTVHAENTSIVNVEKQRLQDAGRTDWKAHMESRPVISEIEAITRAILLCEETGCRLHIAHIAAGRSVDIIRRAKHHGIRVTCETGPHNLTLTDADYERLGPSMFMNPPVRPIEDQNALWQGIRDGTVDMISTDHSPHSEEEKFAANSVWKTKSGLAGVETSVPVMLTTVNAGKLTLEQYVKVSSFNQAHHFRIYPRKGAIQVGSDADFTIVDMGKTGIIRKEDLKSKTKVMPYDGFHYTGAPVYTIIRGNIAMKDGVVDLSKRVGQLI
ncbi:MAG: dihydroorotase family protein [Methylobacteriaceae bacterium]|jgi:dihydroorotase|nr:dihydroorotase family protein [Methylobacteriaceae bacterium]